MHQSKPSNTTLCGIFFLLLIFSNYAQSVSIVRVQFNYGGLSHPIDIELFDNDAPNTVANYLDYVINFDSEGIPKYNGTFIYRNVPGFILQTGGYTFRPPDPFVDALISPTLPNPVGLATVTHGPFSPVVNEPGISNLRGTVAMAKIAAEFVEGGDCAEAGPDCTLVDGTGPDTATSEWFINLDDNEELDSANGGFTVFGSIIDDGLNIADEISTFPDRPFAGVVLGPSFANLPVVNYDTVTLPAVLQENLVMITTISPINRPILRFSPNNIDFFLDVAGDGVNPTQNVTVKNTGNETLTISAINIGDIATPFNIFQEDCSNKTLAPVSITPSDSCTINFTFSPVISGAYADNITIFYSSLPGNIPYEVTVNLSGEGVPSTPVLDIPVTSIQFADTIVNEISKETNILVTNKGGDPLLLSSISITGVDSNEFTITTTNCVTNNAMQLGDTCDINIKFIPEVSGTKTAELIIQSNVGNAKIPIDATAIIPEISVEPTFTIIAEIGTSRKKFLNITNTGTSLLVINNAFISGPDSVLFSQENNCPDTNNINQQSPYLGPEGVCQFLIEFTQTNGGDKTATLTIESNDPLNPSTVISLNGTGERDTDGVPGDIELLAPNSGDANNDEITDDTQNDVASIVALNSNYITFITDKSILSKATTMLADVTLLSEVTVGSPENANFYYGMYSYSITLPTGDGVNMAILLPVNENPDVFYKFGPTSDNTTPHWYDFSYSENTGVGAKFIGRVTLISPTGDGIERNFVLVTYFDGLDGDDDLVANGIITNSNSGLSFKEPTSTDSSGSINYIFLFMLLMISTASRQCTSRRHE